MKNESAFPTSLVYPMQEGPNPGDVFNGLTKREWFAGLAMQGILAWKTQRKPQDIVNDSIRTADALIAELERKEE